jgi:hypothetical protein
MWKEISVIYFNIISRTLLIGTEGKQKKKPQSKHLVFWPRFEPGTSRIQVWNVTTWAYLLLFLSLSVCVCVSLSLSLSLSIYIYIYIYIYICTHSHTHAIAWHKHIVKWRLKAGIVEPGRRSTAGQRLAKRVLAPMKRCVKSIPIQRFANMFPWQRNNRIREEL